MRFVSIDAPDRDSERDFVLSFDCDGLFENALLLLSSSYSQVSRWGGEKTSVFHRTGFYFFFLLTVFELKSEKVDDLSECLPESWGSG